MKRSLRYHLGNLPNRLTQFALSHPWFPLFRTACSGTEWAYDVCRHAGRRHFNTIFDVGANVGQTALYLDKFFPRSAIHSFELSPSTAAVLKSNTSHRPNIHVHPTALGGSPTHMVVESMDCTLINSMRFALADANAARPSKTEEIEVTTLDLFAAKEKLSGIDILKIDAQGFDLQVLEGGEGLIRAHKIPFIYVEITFDKHHTDAQWFLPVHEHLLERGYHLCGIYEQWFRGSLLDCCNGLYFNPAALTSTT
jgi:FkbM family methyltransferase